MTDELLSMLEDMAKKDDKEKDSHEEVKIEAVKIEGETKEVTLSPHAIEVDPWCKRVGEELKNDEEKGFQPLEKVDEIDTTDLFTSFFEPEPRLKENCSRDTKKRFIQTMMETAEFLDLKADTCLHVDASEIAALSIARKLDELEDVAEKEKKRPDDMDVLGKVGEGLKEAEEEVDTAREAAMACGMGEGSKGSHDPKRTLAVYKKVKDNPKLRRIIDMAGRMRRFAAALQRTKPCHGQDDLVGVKMAAELMNLLPYELTMFQVEELQLDWLRRFTEEQLSCHDWQGKEGEVKGPIIISLDESGSMEGSKIETAKALALTIAWIARLQKRWCGLIAYSGDSGHRLCTLIPGKSSEMDILEWLIPFIGYGSMLDVPIRELPDFYKQLGSPAGKTDIILITDAICSPNDKLVEQFIEWKKSVQAKVYGLVIQSNPGKLEAMCDAVWIIPAIELGEEGVKEVLSI